MSKRITVHDFSENIFSGKDSPGLIAFDSNTVYLIPGMLETGIKSEDDLDWITKRAIFSQTKTKVLGLPDEINYWVGKDEARHFAVKLKDCVDHPDFDSLYIEDGCVQLRYTLTDAEAERLKVDLEEISRIPEDTPTIRVSKLPTLDDLKSMFHVFNQLSKEGVTIDDV